MLCRWEVFEDGPITAPEDRLHASLSARNDLLLNGNILERLGNPEAVLLMFDRLNEIIGINPAPPTLPNAFPLKTRKTGRHRIIHATPFCKRFGIRVDATTTFLTPGSTKTASSASTCARSPPYPIGLDARSGASLLLTLCAFH